jgi:hypothetical protein
MKTEILYGYVVTVEPNADRNRGGFVWTVSKSDTVISEGLEFSEGAAMYSGVNNITLYHVDFVDSDYHGQLVAYNNKMFVSAADAEQSEALLTRHVPDSVFNYNEVFSLLAVTLDLVSNSDLTVGFVDTHGAFIDVETIIANRADGQTVGEFIAAFRGITL